MKLRQRVFQPCRNRESDNGSVFQYGYYFVGAIEKDNRRAQGIAAMKQMFIHKMSDTNDKKNGYFFNDAMRPNPARQLLFNNCPQDARDVINRSKGKL